MLLVIKGMRKAMQLHENKRLLKNDSFELNDGERHPCPDDTETVKEVVFSIWQIPGYSEIPHTAPVTLFEDTPWQFLALIDPGYCRQCRHCFILPSKDHIACLFTPLACQAALQTEVLQQGWVNCLSFFGNSIVSLVMRPGP